MGQKDLRPKYQRKQGYKDYKVKFDDYVNYGRE